MRGVLKRLTKRSRQTGDRLDVGGSVNPPAMHAELSRWPIKSLGRRHYINIAPLPFRTLR
jgi:hypothetical protein